MKSFQHLAKVKTVDFNWEDNLFKKTLSKRCFSNAVTKDFILMCEKMLAISYSQARVLETYLRIWLSKEE